MSGVDDLVVYDADPRTAPWRGHERDGHLQRHAAKQFAEAWGHQGQIEELVRQRTEVERRLSIALGEREDALAVVSGLRFSDRECVQTLRTLRQEAHHEDYLDPSLGWLVGAPVPFKEDSGRPRPLLWDRRRPQIPAPASEPVS